MSKPTKAEKKATARARRQRKRARQLAARRTVEQLEQDRRERCDVSDSARLREARERWQRHQDAKEAARAVSFPHCAILLRCGDGEHVEHRLRRVERQALREGLPINGEAPLTTEAKVRLFDLLVDAGLPLAGVRSEML